MKRIINYSFGEFVGDVWHYVRPYKPTFFFFFFLRLTSDIAHLYPVWALSQVVLILSKPFDQATVFFELSPLFLFWGLSSIYYSLTHNTCKYFGFQVAERASLDIYKQALAHLFKLDLTWQEKENSGNKMKRIDRGLDAINVIVRRIFNVIIEVAVNLVGIVVVFFTLEVPISLALLFFITTNVMLGTYFLRRAIAQERVVNKAFENLNGLTFESLNNIHTIKSLAIDLGVLRLIFGHTRKLIGMIRKRIYYYQSMYLVVLTYQTVFGFGTTLFLTQGVVSGRFEISLLILFIGLFQRVVTSANELTEVIQEMSLAKVWLSRAKHILTTKPVIENPEVIKKQINYQRSWQKINIKNLKFSYKDLVTLNNITFTIKRGERVGIVGLSGAGKSTLFKLMLDLYENYQGEIAIDDIPLKKIKRQSYIDHVAVVLQDTELFDMSLADNIRIAAVSRKLDNKNLLAKVVDMAHLTDVVESLPKGVDTIVGEKGIKLSGGQRQRVGIARALYREPDILLLDEATSHLDGHSEREIQKALSGFLHKYTTIVIAHRLSTIRAMDKIVVLERGGVVEMGSFGELIKKKGAFAKMWEEQKI